MAIRIANAKATIINIIYNDPSMTYDNKWIEKFNEHVKTIQIEFDAFLKNRNLAEYYDFHRGANGELISLHFNKIGGLPREIENALTEAFIKAKPAI